jgi:hypothetical protein
MGGGALFPANVPAAFSHCASRAERFLVRRITALD